MTDNKKDKEEKSSGCRGCPYADDCCEDESKEEDKEEQNIPR